MIRLRLATDPSALLHIYKLRFPIPLYTFLYASNRACLYKRSWSRHPPEYDCSICDSYIHYTRYQLCSSSPRLYLPRLLPHAFFLCTTIDMQLLHGMSSMHGLCGVSLVAISSLALDLLQGRHRPSAQHLDGSCSAILWMVSPTRVYLNKLLTRSTDRSSTHTERNFGMNWYSCCFTLTAVNATWISTRLYSGMLCGDTGL